MVDLTVRAAEPEGRVAQAAAEAQEAVADRGARAVARTARNLLFSPNMTRRIWKSRASRA